jgi:signal transduction histidine kinase
MALIEGFERVQRSRAIVPLAMAVAAALLVVSEIGFRRTELALVRRDTLLVHGVELAKLQRLVLVAESSHRGYLMTGRPAYKQPFDEVLPQLDQQLRTVESQYAVEPVTAADIRRLAELVRRKIAEMRTVVQMFESSKDDGWRELMLTDIGRETMVEFESIARKVNAEEAERVGAAARLLDGTLQASRVAIDAMVLAGLAVLLALIGKARRLAAERTAHVAALRGERDLLEGEVQRRTADITEIARHLQNAREDERSRLARELHDELGGLLTAAKLDVARLRNKLAAATPEATERLVHLVRTLDAGIALKRRIIEDLHPSSLGNLGLKAALEILCAEFAAGSQIEVVTTIAEPGLDKAAELTIYRLVQEALTNAAKYAHARRIEVSLVVEDQAAMVTVKDDGVGFDPTRVAASTHGLAGMRFRVQSARGRLELHSAVGVGTTNGAWLPRG